MLGALAEWMPSSVAGLSLHPTTTGGRKMLCTYSLCCGQGFLGSVIRININMLFIAVCTSLAANAQKRGNAGVCKCGAGLNKR
jgi:hypothetical protein